MKVQNVAIDRVLPYEKNPRKNEKAVEKVAASIKAYGFRVPIIVDAQMVIVADHTRLLAAKLLGLETVPVHVAADLTSEQCKAYRIADNKTAEFAEWDMDLLAQEILELKDVDFDLSLTAFEDDEISDLLNFDEPEPVKASETSAKEVDVDEFSLACKCPRCGFEFNPKVANE